MRFAARLGERGVVVPGDPKEEFGAARAPVAGTVNGTPFRGRLMVYGGVTYLGFRKEIRDAAGITQGDEAEIEIEIERDDAPRDVEIPEALATALAADPSAQSAFDSLAFTHRKEYASWVAEAKKDDTRARRVARTLEMLRGGEKHP